MRIKTILQNFILWLLLLVMTLAGCSAAPVSGYGHHTLPREETTLCAAASRLSEPVDFWSKQTAESRSEVTLSSAFRNARTVSCRGPLLLFLFYVLTLLSVYSVCNRQRLILQGARYLSEKSFTISFMQDTDGRKRILSF